MRRGKNPYWQLALIILALGCSREQTNTSSETMSAEQKQVIGKWFVSKVSDQGNLTRDLEFHAKGGKFTTTCRSAYDDAVAHGQGEGSWSVADGVVKVKWVETQKVGRHSQQVDYELTLRIESSGEETVLMVPDNQDVYKRK